MQWPVTAWIHLNLDLYMFHMKYLENYKQASVSLYIFGFVFVLIFWAIALDYVLLCVSTDLGKVTLTL